MKRKKNILDIEYDKKAHEIRKTFFSTLKEKLKEIQEKEENKEKKEDQK